MAVLDPSQLSSNWKKLQKTLQAERPRDSQDYGLKRKRNDEPTKNLNADKRVRLTNPRPSRPVNHRKMDAGASKSDGARMHIQQSSLAQEHDVRQEDISAAYGTMTSINGNSPSQYTTDENGGLHSTHKVGKYVALDCEMVGTGPPPYLDNVLARASLVNFHGEQIYDSYVLPPTGIEVKDYRTFVSGIKPSHLTAGYARAFPDVQKDVARLLDGRILVGHALRNDLQALLFSHPKRDLRDTSRYARFREASKGKPPALRDLARRELGMEIQKGEHSSIEDARAAMMLFKKEKAGFEEENRNRFGRNRRPSAVSGVDGRQIRNGETVDVDDQVESEDEFNLLDGENDEEADGSEEVMEKMPGLKAKKRKKKKRTKRK